MNTTHPVLKTVTEVEGSLRDSRSQGDCRTRRCSNGVVTPSSKTLILSWLRPPPSLASWVRKPFNLDIRNRFVVAYRGLAGAVARSCVRACCVHFVRGSEPVSAGVTTAVPARHRAGPGR